MAAQTSADGGGLRGLFETPMLENPTLLEALSAWTHHRRRVVAHPSSSNIPLVDAAAFTEIFGELHFREKPEQHRAVLLPPAQQAPAPASWAEESKEDESSLDALLRPRPRPAAASSSVRRSASFCLKQRSSASALLMCTEGLGSESTIDADDMLRDGDGDGDAAAALVVGEERVRAADVDGGAAEETKEEEERAPPPIRSIGRGGKPGVCFRSFRADGRFVLVEVVIPGKELLHACRDGGRLRLQFANAAAAAAGVGVGVGEEARREDEDHAENAFVAEGGSNPNPIVVCPN
ncbi:hypothetical protein PR202_gb00491 [Eleusine coracana subsp. coracana]|uniref:FAF domain-containing protein n=1 Tax=Eleusine coracana subsp. coracana TaxID=191504 RepID=A0AAV5DUZ5_ELECO|nr:hypothetical protein QOZ80_5BG0428890 [Eleusine coracana subsp. coracana]GJN13750.1 hypothetical protein PR202_gb00491 [Eleusine coracana subsp. coracana]